MADWRQGRTMRDARIAAGATLAGGKIVAAADATRLLEAVLCPGGRVCLEGDNQKQADLLAGALAALDPARVSGPHIVQSGIVLPAHLDMFERGIASRLDCAYFLGRGHPRRAGRRQPWQRALMLHRRGRAGLVFARRTARAFLDAGGIAAPGWTVRALAAHRTFVRCRLSPGGSADLLAMALFVEAVEGSGR